MAKPLKHKAQSSLIDWKAHKEKRQDTGDSRKRANELDGTKWTQYSISVWSDIRKTQEELELGHPAIFPSALVTRLIEVFTNKEQTTVLDPFVGIGSTALAAKRLGKKGIGLELSSEFAKKAERRCANKRLFDSSKGEAIIHNGSCFDLLDYVPKGSVDLVITSPPYWNILTEKRTADNKEIRDYGDNKGDLGTISSYRTFLRELKKAFALVYETMRPGAYCCVIVMDLRKKSKFYPFHSDIAHFMQNIGFIYDDIIIWDRRHEYNNLRPLGYPAVFRVNKAHEFILIFQKAKE